MSRSHRFLVLAAGALALLCPGPLPAQADTSYVQLPEGEEIALARSAAPPAVAADATVWVVRNGRYVIAIEGTNGNHCFVARSHPRSLEPVCYDREAAATILPWELEYFALRRAGKAGAELEAALAEAVGAGRLRAPSRPAMAYMMSAGQRLYDPESGRSAGNWRPHLMLYIPYLTAEAIGLAGPTRDVQVARPGTPMAYLVVVVPEFVQPAASR